MRLLRFYQWCSISLLTGSVLFAAEEKAKPVMGVSPYWTQLETNLGSINVGGTLRLNYTLGEVQALRILGLHYMLEHVIETDAKGHGRSSWRITGLRTVLAPADSKHLRWQPLSGAPVSYTSAKIGRALGEAGDPRWLIREATPSIYEIRALDGRGWRYENGVLTTAEHPALGTLRFVTQGGQVREIRLGDAWADAPALLRADYDDNARLGALTLAGQGQHRFVWNEAGQLIVWQRPDQGDVRFSYSNGLLVKIVEKDKAERCFTWAENSGYGRGDSRWASPVHLASDETSSYFYNIASKGFIIRRRARVSGLETVTVFNPRRRSIEQTAGGATLIVNLRKGVTPGRSGLEKITTGTGEILEEYRYDGRGQLIALMRKGEPLRTLSYDESGRLMALGDEVMP